MWGLLAGLGAGALMGKLKADQERKNIEAQNKAAAEQSRYSWASGMGPGQISAVPSAWGNVMQGAISGGMMGQAASQLGGGVEKPDALYSENSGADLQPNGMTKWMMMMKNAGGGGSGSLPG